MLTASRCVKFEVICKGPAHLTHGNCTGGHCHSAPCPAPAERGKGQFTELLRLQGQLRARIKPLLPWAGVQGWVGAPGVDLGVIWVAKWLFGSGVGLNPYFGKAGVGAQCSVLIWGLEGLCGSSVFTCLLLIGGLEDFFVTFSFIVAAPWQSRHWQQ